MKVAAAPLVVGALDTPAKAKREKIEDHWY